MKIKENKSSESKNLLHAHFLSKTGGSFFKWWKTTKSFQEIFCQRIVLKIWTSLGKKLKCRSHKLETLHEDNLDPVLKKTRKQQIYGGSRSV